MTEATLALKVRLPQGVIFSLPLAGPVTRCFAFFIDLFIVVALLSGLERILSLLVKLSQDLGTGLVVLGYFALWTLYGMLCEYYWQGQTLGKWLLGLRVIDAAALQLEFHQVAIRNLVRTIDLLPVLGLLGGVTMVLNSRLQRLGDLAGGHRGRTHSPGQPTELRGACSEPLQFIFSAPSPMCAPSAASTSGRRRPRRRRFTPTRHDR